MSDWTEQLEQARSHVRPSLVPQRMHGIKSGVDREIRQRPRRRAAMIAGIAGMLSVIGFLTAERWQLGGGAAPVAGPMLKTPQSPMLVLDDGSTVQPLNEAAKIERVETSATKQSVRLSAGKARF